MKDTLEYINKNSEYVFINKDRINSFVNSVSYWEYTYWLDDLKSFLDEKQRIMFAFICESMNFCFWGNESNDDNYENYIGSERLFYNVKSNVKKDISILEIDNIFKIDIDNFTKLIGAEFLKTPLFYERYILLKETMTVIYNKKDDFFKELFSIKSALELLNYITENFWHFDDKSQYKNKTIKFNKRAVLLVNDLFQLSDRIRKNIKSLEKLTGCADYSVPRLLYEYGILNYSKNLLKVINSKELIQHNSIMEIEIRANTLYTIELIKETLRLKNIYLNSIQIDNIIWNMRSAKIHNIPVHRTITIYY